MCSIKGVFVFELIEITDYDIRRCMGVAIIIIIGLVICSSLLISFGIFFLTLLKHFIGGCRFEFRRWKEVPTWKFTEMEGVAGYHVLLFRMFEQNSQNFHTKEKQIKPREPLPTGSTTDVHNRSSIFFHTECWYFWYAISIPRKAKLCIRIVKSLVDFCSRITALLRKTNISPKMYSSFNPGYVIALHF